MTGLWMQLMIMSPSLGEGRVQGDTMVMGLWERPHRSVIFCHLLTLGSCLPGQGQWSPGHGGLPLQRAMPWSPDPWVFAGETWGSWQILPRAIPVTTCACPEAAVPSLPFCTLNLASTV